ncbi:P-loop containing nucleoside triphosphate hydrolase protein [Trichoderma barbatum]
MAQHPAITFGDQNNGSQVGLNNGTINNEFRIIEQLETPPQPFPSIPFRRDPDFINRGDYLDQISRCCSESAGRVALVGLGGVGKSQLAIEFAHRIAETRSDMWVFWIHAATQQRVEEGFMIIANAAKLIGRNQCQDNIPLLVKNWLSNEHNGRWIIILDSADNREVLYGADESGPDQRPLATYLPQSRNGSIIVTTRSRDVAYKLTGSNKNIIEIGPMAQTDALILLEKKLESLSDVEMAKNVIHALECVPLAITQAAAYIQARAPRSSIKKYLAEFQESEHKMVKLLNHDAGDMQRDGVASNAVLTTWQISFDYIHSQRPSAANLLSLMSFFDRQGIPEWVLNPLLKTADTTLQASGLDKAGNSESESSDDGSHSEIGNDNSSDTSSTFEDDIAMLRNYCLITTNKEGDKFEMHRLVQLSMKYWLKAFGQQERFKQQYIERMAASFPTGKYENWAICQDLFAHVQVALDYRPNENRLEEWATLCYNGAVYARLQGRYDIAEQMANEARKAREKKLGKDNTLTLQSISLLALIISVKGRWEEAEKLQVQVTEIRKTKLGSDHPSTLTSMGNLASTYWNQGRWKEAEKLEVQVMEIRKTKLGSDHPNTLTSMNNIALTYSKQGRWKEAEKIEVQVMEIRKTKLGPDHPDTLLSMSNLASTYWNQSRWKEAEKLDLQVMEIRKIKLGPDHPDTLTSMGNLASTYKDQGRWKEAEKLDLQVMEIRKIKLGPDHPDTLLSMNNLAHTWKCQSRHENALALMKDCLQARRRVLGLEHPGTLASLEAVEEWS